MIEIQTYRFKTVESCTFFDLDVDPDMQSFELNALKRGHCALNAQCMRRT